MTLRNFDIGSWLDPLDPKLAQAFREKFQDAVRDCMRRPNLLKEKRVLTLKVEILPSASVDTGQVDAVLITPILTDPKLPPMARARPFELAYDDGGALKFNEGDPHDVRQALLFGDSESNETEEEGALR